MFQVVERSSIHSSFSFDSGSFSADKNASLAYMTNYSSFSVNCNNPSVLLLLCPLPHDYRHTVLYLPPGHHPYWMATNHRWQWSTSEYVIRDIIRSADGSNGWLRRMDSFPLQVTQMHKFNSTRSGHYITSRHPVHTQYLTNMQSIDTNSMPHKIMHAL